MSEDLKEVIGRKIWTVDELVIQSTRLASDANILPSEARKNLPIFPGDWLEDKVRNYLERLGNAIRNPIRHRNKSLLEEVGVDTKGIPDEVLDDSSEIENIVRLYRELLASNKRLAQFVVEKGFFPRWLKEGIERAKLRLTELSNAESAFSRIFESEIDEQLIDELAQRCVGESEYIDTADGFISKIGFVSEFEISTEYHGNFDIFCESVDSVYQTAAKFQDLFGIPKDEITQLVKGKTIDEADSLLKDSLRDYSQQRDRLLEEWRIYSTALKSLDHEVPEQPQGFYKLREETAKLRQACRETLGVQGIKLIQFLKGESDFPKKISKSQIRRTLKILRPLFKSALGEEI